MILGLYLFIPIINTWIKKANFSEIRYYLIIWVVVLSFNMPYLNKFYTRIDFVYFTGYLGYVILGYYLYKTEKFKNKAIFIYSIGFLVTYFLTFVYTINEGKFTGVFFKYLTPNVLLASIGVFMMFKNREIKNKFFLQTIQFFSKYSYGTYLSHVAVIIFLSKFNLMISTPIVFISILLNATIILVVSTGLVFAINKLPLGKYISG
jgi:surface polysaccharide O-acyltransferase-like enzyme